jgi:hypothetical protein
VTKKINIYIKNSLKKICQGKKIVNKKSTRETKLIQKILKKGKG